MFKRSHRSTRRALVSTTAVTLALAGGGVAGAVLGAPLISSAQEDGPTTTTEDTVTDDTQTDDTETDNTVTDDTEPGGAPSDDTSGETNDECHGGPGFGGHGIISETVTELLGIDEDTLREALAGGQTLAEIAEEQGVSRDELVGALVAEAETRIDERVADGDIEADEATELKEHIAERIDEMVDGELGDRGDRPGGPGGPWFGPGMPRPGERFDGGDD